MACRATTILFLALLPALSLGHQCHPTQKFGTVTQPTITTTVTMTRPGSSNTSSSTSHGSVTSSADPSSSNGNASLNSSANGTISIGRTSSPANSSAASSSRTSDDVTQEGCMWNVPGVGLFANKATYNFSGNSLPSGLQASNYSINDQADGAPWNHDFQPANVAVSNHFLNLLVPGGQNPVSDPNQSIHCAEITTVEDKIIMASVRTNAIFSSVPGTCHGNFFYKSDNQEIDIEYLTDPSSQSNPPNGVPNLQYTNQPVKIGGQPTFNTSLAPADVTRVHEYRIDWIRGEKTMFYLDGQLQTVFTSNVPTKPGPWVWNNWANGDPGFTVGPPAQDNVFKIQSITMYYNTTSTATTC